jgi:hypothetical protein
MNPSSIDLREVIYSQMHTRILGFSGFSGLGYWNLDYNI